MNNEDNIYWSYEKIGIKNPVSVQVTEAPEMKPLNFILNISGIQASGKIVIYLL